MRLVIKSNADPDLSVLNAGLDENFFVDQEQLFYNSAVFLAVIVLVVIIGTAVYCRYFRRRNEDTWVDDV